MHASSPLIESLSLQFKHDLGKKVVLHIQYSHFEVVYYKDGNLQFYNSFNYTTGEDLIYYVLFVFEQLGLNQDQEDFLFWEKWKNMVIPLNYCANTLEMWHLEIEAL